MTEWPAGSAGGVLSCEVNGHGLRRLRPAFVSVVTFHLVFFRGSVRVSRVGV